MDVTVRAGRAGTVLVGPRPAAPAGTGVVLVTGAEIYVDPTAPDDLPFALVHDVDEAEAAMHAVYGSAVAATVLEVAESRTNTLAPLADLPGLAAELVRRIGLVRWLETHSPDELPQGLLDLEFGSASCALDDLLADPEREDAEARLLRRAGLAVRLSRRLRDSGGPPAPSGLAALLVDALPWVHRVVPYSSPDFDDVLHEVELAAALRELAPDGAVFDWDALAEAPGVGGRELATSRSRSAGRPRDLEVPRRASVDWWQVPRGVLRTAEDTVEWQLTDGATRVAVTVAATPGAPAAALAFRLFAGDLPVPIAVGALQLTDDGAAFRGSAPLHGTPAGELTLDVHDPTARRPARLGADRAIAQAVRWAARGITAVRLGAVAAAVDALDESALLFERVADEHGRAAEQQRATRRAARCRTVQIAVLPVELPASPAVAPSDVRVPDLAGPGWRPLAAESALGADPVWRT